MKEGFEKQLIKHLKSNVHERTTHFEQDEIVFGSTQNSSRGKSGGNRNKIIKIGGSNTHISPRLEHSAWLIRCVLDCGGGGARCRCRIW